jgi:hypothetical protein
LFQALFRLPPLLFPLKFAADVTVITTRHNTITLHQKQGGIARFFRSFAEKTAFSLTHGHPPNFKRKKYLSSLFLFLCPQLALDLIPLPYVSFSHTLASVGRLVIPISISLSLSLSTREKRNRKKHVYPYFVTMASFSPEHEARPDMLSPSKVRPYTLRHEKTYDVTSEKKRGERKEKERDVGFLSAEKNRSLSPFSPFSLTAQLTKS